MAQRDRTPAAKNRLQNEKSPYLQQHASNPVDWYPWCEEAFEQARREDKPVFLSIGYSTCHWCHVMERESFEDPEVARLLNDVFVAVKVDREERPDIDAAYMAVCQMMSPSCGWPLTIIMTPDKQPFFASTYIPKENRYGRSGMLEMVPRVGELWRNHREAVLSAAKRVTGSLSHDEAPEPAGEPGEAQLRAAYEQLNGMFDERHGGFGSAPKFPSPHSLSFLLRWWKRSGERRALEMVESTLWAMRRGGIFDQIGFGFHRYSTDAEWLLPHFEKMLYDQAMLAIAYTEAFQATGNPEYEKTAREVFEYVLRDMRSPEGAFFSAEDADSEGVEGKFYLWTEEEIRGVPAPADAGLFIAAYGIEKEGNFRDEATKEKTGANIPIFRLSSSVTADKNAVLERSRTKLLEVRGRRVRPGLDDKILTDWNGLMIAALAKAAQAFGDAELAEAAMRAANFLLDQLRDDEGRLLHRYRDGEAAINAFADDHAYLVWGLLELYEATFMERYLMAAVEINADFLERFQDGPGGDAGFFFTPDDGETLLRRQKESYDGAVPSSNSVAMLNLLRLARVTGNPELEAKAAGIARTFAGLINSAPAGFTFMLSALDFALGPAHEIVVAGKRGAEDTLSMLRALQSRFAPNKVVLLRPSGDGEPAIASLAPFTREQTAVDGKATAYVCSEYACAKPVTDIDEMLARLSES